jgi:serine phosphatase RsbU (regulator of sigma subunit)
VKIHYTNAMSTSLEYKFRLKWREKSEKILFYISLIAAPLWLLWILFDYFFSPSHTLTFLPLRIGGTIMSLLVVYLIKYRKQISVPVLQIGTFTYYQIALVIMFFHIDLEPMYLYFSGFNFISVVLFSVLVLTPLELLAYSLLVNLSWICIVFFNRFDPIDIIGNGGFVAFNINLIVMLVAYLRIKSNTRELESQLLLEDSNEQIAAKNKEIIDSITYAKRIQTAILPPKYLFSHYLPESFILYKPKDIVAGDFYWLETYIHTLQETKTEHPYLLFAAADCTGHGVPGAMVSVICNNALNRSVREFSLFKPNEILEKSREIIVKEFEKSTEDVKDGMDISLCALSLHSEIVNGTETRKMLWSGANNPLWIIRKNSTKIEIHSPSKQPIGKYQLINEPFSLQEIVLEEGDSFYIFTDGFADQFGGPKGKKFLYKQLKDLLLTIQKESMSKQKQLLDHAFEKWRGALEQVDDVCFIGVRI